MKWNITSKKLPENGTIVEVKTKKGSCSCAGTQKAECYFENGEFKGIRRQDWVLQWCVSPANDLIKELEERQKVCAIGCDNCMELMEK